MHLSFENGALLCSDPSGDVDLEHLPDVLWDERRAVYRAPAHLYAELRARLRAAEVAFTDAVLERPAAASWGEAILRPHQAAALEAWELGGRSGVIVLPHEGGRRRLALAAMARAGVATLCLVPSAAHAAAWAARLRALYRGAVAMLGDRCDAVTVGTFAAAAERMERLGNRFELLVVDEPHAAPAALLDACAAPMRLGLGSRASPAARWPVVYHASARHGGSPEEVRLEVQLGPDECARLERAAASLRPLWGAWAAAHPHGSWNDFSRAVAAFREGRAALAACKRARRTLVLAAGKLRLLSALLRAHRGERVAVVSDDAGALRALSERFLLSSRRGARAVVSSAAARDLDRLDVVVLLDETALAPPARLAVYRLSTRGAPPELRAPSPLRSAAHPGCTLAA